MVLHRFTKNYNNTYTQQLWFIISQSKLKNWKIRARVKFRSFKRASRLGKINAYRFQSYKRLRKTNLVFGFKPKFRFNVNITKNHKFRFTSKFLQNLSKEKRRYYFRKRPHGSVIQHLSLKKTLQRRNISNNIKPSIFTTRNLKKQLYGSKPTHIRKFKIKRYLFGNLSPKRYRFETRVCFYHNNIRLVLDNRFAHQRQIYSMGFFPEFAKRKKLKRGYVAGLDLCLYFYKILRDILVIRSFIIKSGGGFGARKGFFNGLRKLKFITSKKPRIFLLNLTDNTRYSHNGTKRAARRRL